MATGPTAMHAGKLRERISFLVQASGQDALGQPNGAWAAAPSTPDVWAHNAGVSSRDIAHGAAHSATVDAKWIIRARSDVLPTWRVSWKGVLYDIVGHPTLLSGSEEWLEIRGRKVLTV
ncbi:MAG: Phage head-tail joining protein [Pseudomonadota bacterium]|jgi:SPP1 family predicted phage head-tail adaptor